MFTVQTEAGVKEYATLALAKQYANRAAKSKGIELEVVNSETGSVAHMATYVEGRHFHPWERVETPKFQSPHFEGFYSAYTRPRVGAAVYRAYGDEAELKWLVWDGRTGGKRLVATTKAACALTKAMLREGLML
jgi:hypothetical protein